KAVLKETTVLPEPRRISDRQKKLWRAEMSELMPEKTAAEKIQPQRYSVPTQKIEKQIDRIAPDFIKADAPVYGAKLADSKTRPPVPALSSDADAKATAAIPRPKASPKKSGPPQPDPASRRVQEQARQAEIDRKKKATAEAKRLEKLARRQKRQAWLNSILKAGEELKVRISIVIHSSFYILTVTAITIFLLYSILAIIELKFSADNLVLRSVSRYFPVPAIITKNSFIEYYHYQDIISQNNQPGNVVLPAGEEMKVYIAKLIAAAELKQKYQLKASPLGSLSADEKEKLSYQVVLDATINQVGLGRIKKIKQMIDENGDFVQIAGKYGDELGQVTITAANEKNYPYSAAVIGLDSGEISDIVYTADGYYIFRCYEKNAERSALSFAFVRAKTFDQYLTEAAKMVKMWSLVN
ncbi:MAG: peptidylprolyl isomerase, partial [Planctomycetes bacterium]|nr:peptidylprolyl isomerase [Planctomycetota bacterium]